MVDASTRMTLTPNTQGGLTQEEDATGMLTADMKR